MKTIIKNAVFCDAEREFTASMLLEHGRIAAIAPSLEEHNAEVIDAGGHLVMPGMVDTHVHLQKAAGFKMLLAAGVTSALDMGSEKPPCGSSYGINTEFMYVLVPGRTIRSANPSGRELADCITRAMDMGARGIKIMGGHFPVTPGATKLCIELCARRSFPCAVHVGTTEKGSNIQGLEQLLELRGENPLHIAHINSYCRGLILGDPKAEALRALELLDGAKNIFSESYLDIINGTSARVDASGRVVSLLTAIWLKKGGFDPSRSGIEKAIKNNWAKVNGEKGDLIVLLDASEGLDYFKTHPESLLSFPVNCPVTGIMLAAAKDSSGRFIVNALSTDGGEIPRNTNLYRGLTLVDLNILSLNDFIQKSCWQGAKYLGFKNKGRFSVGADADLIIVDRVKKTLLFSFIAGKNCYHRQSI